MEIYLKPIISACYVFPVLAVLFTLPYIIYEYHKYGSILVIRTGVVYTFIFYMITSYFMTVLPLPPIDSVTPDSACMLLVPFDAVRRVVATVNITLSNPATYINLFKCGDFWQIAFNILLLVPFGVYLRYYFKRKWWQVLIMSFCYSLFFELTQLSGLYGIYPYPYRFFEVDDLICNTLGGMVGFWVMPAVVFMLPKRDRMDEVAYNRGQIVSEFRRIIAWALDMLVIMAPVAVFFAIDKEKFMNAVYDVRYLVVIAVYIVITFTIVTAVTKGRTIGKALVNIRLVRADSKKTDNKTADYEAENIEADTHRRVNVFRLMGRYFILYVLSLPSPVYAYNLYHVALKAYGWRFSVSIAVCVLCLMVTAYFAIDFILCLFSSTRQMFYDRVMGITHVNMVKQKEKISK